MTYILYKISRVLSTWKVNLLYRMKHFYFSSFDQSLYKGLLSIYLTNHDFPTYNEYVFTTYTYIVNTFRAESINIEKEGTLQWRRRYTHRHYFFNNITRRSSACSSHFPKENQVNKIFLHFFIAKDRDRRTFPRWSSWTHAYTKDL